jgi:hypothetical protein
MRWEIVSRISKIAGLITLIDNKCVTEKTLDPRAPLKFVNHQFGLYGVTIPIPDYIQAFDVYLLVLNGCQYVCGIGYERGPTYSFYGPSAGSLQMKRPLPASIHTIRFAADGFGIRFLDWGASHGLPEGRGTWWEGFDEMQGSRELRIVHDVSRLGAI